MKKEDPYARLRDNKVAFGMQLLAGDKEPLGGVRLVGGLTAFGTRMKRTDMTGGVNSSG